MNCLICGKSFSEIKFEKEIILYCGSCDLYIRKNIIKTAESYKSDFWEKSDYSEFTGTDFTDKGVQDLVLTFESWYSYFKPFLNHKRTILDIGSGTGVSCILLEKKGYNVIGVDPDSKNSKLINSKLKFGKCINCYFEDLKIEKKVEVIWITHVLEHLSSPDALLLKCKEWLSPDGIICIAVPDSENPDMLKNSLKNPYHIYHFTKNSLKKLFQKCSYNVIKCDSFATMNKTKRRIHKVMRNAGFTNFSRITEPYYPFKLTSNKDGYEIRCIIK